MQVHGHHHGAEFLEHILPRGEAVLVPAVIAEAHPRMGHPLEQEPGVFREPGVLHRDVDPGFLRQVRQAPQALRPRPVGRRRDQLAGGVHHKVPDPPLPAGFEGGGEFALVVLPLLIVHPQGFRPPGGEMRRADPKARLHGRLIDPLRTPVPDSARKTGLGALAGRPPDHHVVKAGRSHGPQAVFQRDIKKTEPKVLPQRRHSKQFLSASNARIVP